MAENDVTGHRNELDGDGGVVSGQDVHKKGDRDEYQVEGQNRDSEENEERDAREDGDKNKNGGKSQARGENDKETTLSDDIAAEGTTGTGTDADVKNKRANERNDSNVVNGTSNVPRFAAACNFVGKIFKRPDKKYQETAINTTSPTWYGQAINVAVNHGTSNGTDALAGATFDDEGKNINANNTEEIVTGEHNVQSQHQVVTSNQNTYAEAEEEEEVLDQGQNLGITGTAEDLVEGVEGETNTEIVKETACDLQIPLSGDAVRECSADQTDDSVTTLDIIPTSIDPDVILVTGSLHGELRFTELCKNLKKLGDYLRLATNAVADDATLLIKVQSALFDVVKLCDAVSLLMQNFMTSSNNIIEKLHVAFLYLLDGFPDFAKSDIECISKDVKSMQERGLKCLKVVSNLKIKIEKKSELWIKCGQKTDEYVSLASQPEWMYAFVALPDMSRRNNQLTVPSTDAAPSTDPATDAYEEISDAEVQRALENSVEYPENNAESKTGIKDVLDNRSVVCSKKLSGDLVVIESHHMQPSQKSVTTVDHAPAEEKRAVSAGIRAWVTNKVDSVKGFIHRIKNAAGSPTQKPAGLGDTSNTETTKLPSQDEPKVSGDREKMEKARQVKNSYFQAQLLQQLLRLSVDTLENTESLIKETNRLVDSWDMECKDVIEPWLVVGFQEAEKLTLEDQKEYWKSLWFQKRARDYYNRWCALGAFCDSHHSEVKKVRREVDGFYTENLYPREAVQFAWRLAEDIDNDDIKGLVDDQKRLNMKM